MQHGELRSYCGSRVEYKFIQNHFHPKTTFIPKPLSSQNHFHPNITFSSQNHIFIPKPHFHPKTTLSSKNTFIPKTLSSQTTFIPSPLSSQTTFIPRLGQRCGSGPAGRLLWVGVVLLVVVAVTLECSVSVCSGCVWVCVGLCVCVWVCVGLCVWVCLGVCWCLCVSGVGRRGGELGSKWFWDESGHGMKVVMGWKWFGMKVVLDENFGDENRHLHPNLDETVPNRFQACQRVRPPVLILQPQWHFQDKNICERVLPPVLIFQPQWHLHGRRAIILYLPQARVLHRPQQCQATVRLKKGKNWVRLIPFQCLCQAQMFKKW